MCGIAGLFDSSGAAIDRGILLRMLARIAHRGPDGGGWIEDDGREIRAGDRDSPTPRDVRPLADAGSAEGPRVALGHQRLAITDLSQNGRQPLSRGAGRWWIVFNGAIYNAAELRTELEASGEIFSTTTDTEVLLAAYVRWGAGALARFNGMWALAIWDTKERELFCARDRFGVKPFFYTWAGGVFGFASEPKALRPLVPAEPDEGLVAAFLRRGGTVGGGDATCYSNYHALPEGSLLRADSSGVRVERWYDLDSRVEAQEAPRSFGDAASRLRELLDSAVRLRLRSDVPVGLFVSGGVDSSGIAGLISRLDGPSRESFSMQTISTRYPNRSDIDETFYVQKLLASTGFRGDTVEPTVEGFERDLDDFIYSADMLVPKSVEYVQWRLFRRARELGLPVMLLGQGSDELFGGYEPWVVYTRQLWRQGNHFDALREAILSSSRLWWLKQGVRRTLGIARSAVSAHACGCRPGATLQDHQRHLLLVNYLPTLLGFEDRNSMAWGVEARTPFLDYRIVEFARTLPDRFLLRNGWTKVVLREALRGIVPESILRRPTKLGLPGPAEGSRGLGAAGVREAWTRLTAAGWLDGVAPVPPRDLGTALGFRIRVLEAWRRRCLGGDSNP
jgi:asparagine synthase (glutamine-hydrolysing)